MTEPKAQEDRPAPEAPSPDKAGKDAGKKNRKDKAAKRREREAEAEKSLVEELDRLRAVTHQIATHYMEMLESEICQIKDAIAGSAGNTDRLSRLTSMHRMLQSLSVKPKKGRRKDLKRIDAMLAELNRRAAKL